MKLRKIFRPYFFISLIYKQNKWHKHGVFVHTLKVVYYTIKSKRYDMIVAAILHDIGKPIVAYKDDEDQFTGELSFTNHEEISYQLIKNIPIISQYTKNLVRYHYLIRGIKNAKKKKQINKYRRLQRIYNKLDSKFISDLKLFLTFDDLGK